MVPVSTALQVTLNDSTELEVIRDGYNISISSIKPSPTLWRELSPHIQKAIQHSLDKAAIILQLFGSPEDTQIESDQLKLLPLQLENDSIDRSIMFQLLFEGTIVPNLRIYGTGEHIPQFRNGEAVSLMLVNGDEKVKVVAGTIRRLFRS